jgi:hypothetical protein
MMRYLSLSHRMIKITALCSALILVGAVSACSPPIGSKEWCDAMKKKPKGEWSANEAAEFTKSCIL